jgi:hypothetical protein
LPSVRIMPSFGLAARGRVFVGAVPVPITSPLARCVPSAGTARPRGCLVLDLVRGALNPRASSGWRGVAATRWGVTGSGSTG